MKRDKFGFTLIELLVTIAIVGILAALAIPFFEGYKVRAKLTEVENAMSTIASSVTAYYLDHNTFPTCPTVNEVRNSLGVSLQSITRMRSISIIDGVITVEIQDNIHPMVTGKLLILTPTPSSDGSLSWRWGTSPDYPIQFRPKGN